MIIIEMIVSRAMAAADRFVRCVGCAIIFIIFCDVIVSLDVKRQLCLQIVMVFKRYCCNNIDYLGASKDDQPSISSSNLLLLVRGFEEECFHHLHLSSR